MKDKIFIIPIDNLLDNKSSYSLLYSPFVHGCTIISSEEKERIEQAKEEGSLTAENFPEYAPLLSFNPEKVEKTHIHTPEQYTAMSILPTYKCNFKCSYCYSAGGRDKKTISTESADTALEYFLRESSNKALRTLFISGGGEPLTAYPELVHIVKKARFLANTNKLKLEIIIITNGSLLKGEVIEFCKQHHLRVCVSFEIAEKAQALSRGNWHLVNENIKNCIRAGLIPSINATITPQNVCFLPDMVNHLLTCLPEIKFVTFEPVTPNEGFTCTAEMRSFYDAFMREFGEARKRAGDSGININTTIMDNMKRVAYRHCQGKLCLTPAATYTICHCASSPKETRYHKCVYGKIENNEVSFDLDKFKSLQNLNALNREKCLSCYARWNCGGGCMSKMDAYPEEQQDEYCNYYREHLKRLLLDEVNENCLKLYKTPLRDLIN